MLERSERSERGRKGVDNESGGVLITSGRAPCIIKTTIESPLQCLGKSKGSHAKMPLPSYPKHTVQPKWNQSTIRAWKSIRNYPTLIRKSGTISIRPFTANNLAMRLFYARPLSDPFPDDPFPGHSFKSTIHGLTLLRTDPPLSGFGTAETS